MIVIKIAAKVILFSQNPNNWAIFFSGEWLVLTDSITSSDAISRKSILPLFHY